MAHRRISDLTGGPPTAPPGIFAPEDDNVIPGEVVFALEADAASEAQVSISNIPAALGAEATAVGSSAVDKVLGRLKVSSVTRVHGPAPTEVVGGMAMASDLGLDTTMRVRYEADEAPEAVAKKLRKLDAVAWAEPNLWREAAIVPNDPQFGSQWGLSRINCPGAWDHTVGDPSVVVAVVDTGVDLNHPELASLLLPGQDLVDFPPGSVPQPGWVFEGDYTGVDAIPQDEVGHGTHVAGTICCASNNGVGVAGVSWNARLLPVRVLARVRQTSTGQVSGLGSSANIAAGIRWATDHGARVINMSLGGGGDAQVEREAVAYAVSKGVVVVAAMGNSNSNVPSYPAAYPGVVAVGATDSSDHRASFSNFGSWIDVAAPGVGIQSTYWDDTYASLSGTSMASPHVAGVAALILSRNSSLSADQVANILRTTAKPLKDAASETIPNDKYGSGLVQADAAVAAAAPVIKTLQLICRPSVAVQCPSLRVICPSVSAKLCPPSRPILCGKSVQIICPSLGAGGCVSVQIACPSKTICPSTEISCTTGVACPSVVCGSLACGSLACHPGGGSGPILPGEESEEPDDFGYDPYQSSYE